MNYTEWNTDLIKKLHIKYGNEIYNTINNSNISKSLHEYYKNNISVDDAVLLYDNLIKNKENNVFWIA